jgi:hypothetical protein
MNRFFLIAAALVIPLAGCARTRVIKGADLPLYGSDPLMHTVYRGSDETFHHFALQHGKSGREVVVRRDELEIKPEPFPVGSRRHAFITSPRPGLIELVLLPRFR